VEEKVRAIAACVLALSVGFAAGVVKDGDTVEVSVQDGQLTLNGDKFAEAA
jgi:hypothetical protein